MKFSTKNIFALSALVLAMTACSTMPNEGQGTPSKLSQGVEKAKSSLADNFPPKPAPQVLAEPNVPLNEPFLVGANDKETDSNNITPSVAETAWQDFYDDDKLKSLITLGLANNKNLERATLAIMRAKTAYQIQEVGNLPSVGSSGSYTVQGTRNGSAGTYRVGLGLASYELDFWGKVSALKEKALQDYLATTAAKDSAQIALISNIAQVYVNISYAKAQLYLAESTVKSREQSLFIAQKRFEAGVDSKAPSLQASASLDSARLAVLNAQTALAKAQNALQYLIGGAVPDELLPDPAITTLVKPAVLNAGLPSELLYHRPDIAQAEYELKSAGANIKVARTAFFPSISLTGEAGFSSTKLSDLFKGSALGWRFVPSISLPIFDAGQRKANYEVTKIAEQDALAKYENAIQTAFREVHDVLADRATLGKQLETQYRLQDSIQQSYNIAYATFRSGLSDYLSVLDAERSLFDVQRSILQLEQQRILKQIELYEKLGGGASLDAPQITKTAQTQEQAMTSAQIAKPDQAMITERSPLSPKQAVEKVLADGVKTPIGGTTPQVTSVVDGTPPADNQPTPMPKPNLQTITTNGKGVVGVSPTLSGAMAVISPTLSTLEQTPQPPQSPTSVIMPTPIPSALLEKPATPPATPVPVVKPKPSTIKRTTSDDDSPIKSLSDIEEADESGK